MDRKKPRIKVKLLKRGSPCLCGEIITLYKEAGWWENHYDPAFVPAMIKGSECFAAAFEGSKLVGMGRAISDGVSDAYIQDIAVLSSYRHQGIGAMILELLGKTLSERGIDWVALVGAPGTQDFYKKSGFENMPDYIPMRLKQ